MEDAPVLSHCSFLRDPQAKPNGVLVLYPARSRWGTYRGYCSRRDGAHLQLRRGVGKAAHTRNNPHVKCVGVY
jgi:hypothetical protein